MHKEDAGIHRVLGTLLDALERVYESSKGDRHDIRSMVGENRVYTGQQVAETKRLCTLIEELTDLIKEKNAKKQFRRELGLLAIGSGLGFVSSLLILVVAYFVK